jgi:hypothetical protein
MTRVLTYADSLADLNGTPRPGAVVAPPVPTGLKLVPASPTMEVRKHLEGKQGVDFLLAYVDWCRPTEATTPQPASSVVAPPVPEPMPMGLCERICSAIKAADDQAVDEAGYMLDSNDCIAIVRQEFARATTPRPASEPYAYDVYFPGEQRAELVRDLDEILEDLTNLEHRVTPLYDHTQPASEPVAQADAINTLCKMLHSGEEVEGDDGLAMMVPMDLWNEAQEAIESLVGEDDAPPQPAAKPRPQPLTEEYIKRHSILAADCPGASVVLLASTVRRLAGITTQEPTA